MDNKQLFKCWTGMILYPKMRQLVLDTLDGDLFVTNMVDEMSGNIQFEEAFVNTLLEHIKDKRTQYKLFDIYYTYIVNHIGDEDECIVDAFETIDDRMVGMGEW